MISFPHFIQKSPIGSIQSPSQIGLYLIAWARDLHREKGTSFSLVPITAFPAQSTKWKGGKRTIYRRGERGGNGKTTGTLTIISRLCQDLAERKTEA
ncbi:hypothetical protein VTI74DRAFT_1257 [Chaetomium olivicolor]